MNSKSLIISVLALITSSSANAAFQNLNNGDSFLSTGGPDFQIIGSGLGPDQGFVLGGDAPAAVDPGFGTFGEAPEEEFFTRSTNGFLLPAGYTIIDENEYEITFPEDGELEEIGILTDQVWRNNSDNTLVFATRVTLFPELDDGPGGSGLFEYEGEFNEVRRQYASSVSTEAAYFAQSGIDRVFDEVSKDSNLVTFVNDMSGEEDNPYSVWHLVATDATDYTQITGALTLFSEFDPSEDRFQNYIFGDNLQSFAPVPVPAAVWLLGSALIGMVGIRKKS